MASMTNKVALITGGGSGIGREAALAFAREGATVVIAGRRQEAGDETVQLIHQAGGAATFIKTDVTNELEVAALVSAVVAQFGRLDYAFNNAGIEGQGGPLTDLTEANWDQLIDGNLKSAWLSLKYEIPQIQKQGGAIVNNASIVADLGFANLAAYSASKAGVIGLTRSAAMEYAKTGVRINVVSPGPIETPMTERMFGSISALNQGFGAMMPIGRAGKPHEIAEAVVWLCSDASSFITGQVLNIDGGFTAQ